MTTIYPTKRGPKSAVLRLNDEQLLSLMASGISEDAQVRAVVKSNKIIGFKVVKKGKNEIIKCSWMNESGAKVLFRDIDSKIGKEVGDLSGRVSLINYRPAVNGDMVEKIVDRMKLRDVVSFIVGNGKFSEDGVKFDEKEVVEKFGNDVINSIRRNDKSDIMDYKWVKLVKCDSKLWRDFLIREGYNDEMDGKIWRMLYSGKVEKEIPGNNNSDKLDEEVKGLILEYQKTYIEYYQLYYNVESNFGIKRLIGMHNKLEELRCKIEGVNLV